MVFPSTGRSLAAKPHSWFPGEAYSPWASSDCRQLPSCTRVHLNHPGLVWWCLEALKRNNPFPRDVVCPRAWPDMWCGSTAQLGSVGWLRRVEGAEMGIAPSLRSAGRTLGLNPGSCTRILSLGYLVHSLQESQGANQQKDHEALPARSLPAVCSQ